MGSIFGLSISDVADVFKADGPLEIILEFGVIWLGVYGMFRFLRGTRGAGVVKGFFLVAVALALMIRVFGDATDGFSRLRFLFDRAFNLLAILLVVVFQPELRAAMGRLGRAQFFAARRAQASGLAEEITDAAEFLSRNRFGALIVIERQIGIGDIAGGTELDAKVSATLLQSIFWPNSPLHDLAVVIRNGRIWGAGVQLPLAEEGSVANTLGSRHRAAVGVTLDNDCLAVVVSEETGGIRIAESGKLSEPISTKLLREELLRRLSAQQPGFVFDRRGEGSPA
ncbi:MAG: diadenylate cyclase [Planctomycetota bacterium]|jgi:diadenylate cyclase|nr:MAG: diadenylate cyclase [Planctomycetota bacterium]